MRRHEPGCPPECNACHDAAYEEAPEPVCPVCGCLLDEHWDLTMSFDDLEEWGRNQVVCTRTRSEVRDLLDRDEERGV